jgi:hypothetical protein
MDHSNEVFLKWLLNLSVQRSTFNNHTNSFSVSIVNMLTIPLRESHVVLLFSPSLRTNDRRHRLHGFISSSSHTSVQYMHTPLPPRERAFQSINELHTGPVPLSAPAPLPALSLSTSSPPVPLPPRPPSQPGPSASPPSSTVSRRVQAQQCVLLPTPLQPTLACNIFGTYNSPSFPPVSCRMLSSLYHVYFMCIYSIQFLPRRESCVRRSMDPEP